MNVYDPTTHGVCGWPRPTRQDERDAARAGRDVCGCGLEVRLDGPTGVWLHYVEGDAPVVVGALPPSAADLAEKIALTRASLAFYRDDLDRLVAEVIDLNGTDAVLELAAELERGQDVARYLDDLERAVAEAAR